MLGESDNLSPPLSPPLNFSTLPLPTSPPPPPPPAPPARLFAPLPFLLPHLEELFSTVTDYSDGRAVRGVLKNECAASSQRRACRSVGSKLFSSVSSNSQQSRAWHQQPTLCQPRDNSADGDSLTLTFFVQFSNSSRALPVLPYPHFAFR